MSAAAGQAAQGLVVAVAGGALLVLVTMPVHDVAENAGSRHTPSTSRPAPVPTGTPAGAGGLDKARLIIEQNPGCWTGVPGQTCEETR